MGERVDKVKEMVAEHEESFENLKETTKQWDEQISKYELENNQKTLHIERLKEEKDEYAKNDIVLSEEYNTQIEQTKKEQEEILRQKEILELNKKTQEKEVEKELSSFLRHDSILRSLTQEEKIINEEMLEINTNMQQNLLKQQNFKLEYDQDGNIINGKNLADLDREYKELTDKLNDLKEAKALCQEYLQKYHEELDNDAKRKFKEVNEWTKQKEPKQEQSKQEEPKQEQPEQGQPKQEEPKQEQPKQGQPKQEEPKQEQPKQEEPKQEQPKQEQPKQEQPKQEQPKQEQPEQRTIDINAFSEKIYREMNSKLRNNIYMYMTGQSSELEQVNKTILEKLQSLYGTDVRSKMENKIKEMAAKEFLKVNEIKTDVTTGMITIDFNCGEKFKPVKIDLRKFNIKGAKMESIKAMKKKIDPNIKFGETMDPYIIKALSDATKKQFEKLGVSPEKINIEDIYKQVNIYQEAIIHQRRVKKGLDINIVYEKSNKEQPIKAGARKFEKVLRPFLKVAEKSAYVQIDDSIQTMTIKDKMKKILGKSWDWLIGENKKLPAGKYLKQEEKPKDDELTKVARHLGIDAQIKIVRNRPIEEFKQNLTEEQEKNINETLLEDTKRRNVPQESKAKSEQEVDREDR